MLAIVRTIFISIYFFNNLFLECQVPTQRYGRRPFGVGFLMAGFDVFSSNFFFLNKNKNFYFIGKRYSFISIMSIS